MPKKIVWGKISYKKYCLDMGNHLGQNKIFEKNCPKKFFWVIFKQAKVCYTHRISDPSIVYCTYLDTQIIRCHVCTTKFYLCFDSPKENTLFRNKRFALNLMPQRNALKFAILLEYENPHNYFSFCASLFFPLMNALVYIDIDQGIHKVKYKVARNEK